MTDRDDPRWDAPTEHDRAHEGDARAITSTTLPPPSFQRQPARPTPARASAHAPTEPPSSRNDLARGGIVVVATGGDAERVRKLSQKHALLVPVMTSIGAVHDALSIVVIGEPAPPAPERVVHVVRPAVPDDQLIDLLRALVGGRTVVEPPVAPATADPKLADLARRLGNLTDRAQIETVMLGAITALADSDRAHCLFHDPATGALWSEARRRAGTDNRRATGGLVGWAAHTGQMLHASPAGDDPRWLQELDDPDEGKPQSRLLVQPIIGSDRRVHTVLVAVRRWRHPDFTDRETKALGTFAALVGPAVETAVATSARKPRITTPGPLAAASKSAIVTAPRASESRPPPLAAWPGSSPALGPDPFSGERTRLDAPPADDHTRVDEAAKPAEPAPVAAAPPPAARAADDETRVDDAAKPEERYSSDSILSLPSPPSLPKRAPTNPVAAPAAPAAAAAAATAAVAPAAAPKRAPTAAGDERSGPVRAPTASDAKRPRLAGEPRDLAVVAGPDDTKRVHKIAKKARLELATIEQLADAPDFYQVVTIGGAWTDDRRVAYAARSTITDDQLTDLLTALTNGRALDPAPLLARPQTVAEARRLQLALGGARKLAASTDLAAAEDVATATLRELLDCDRAYCWFVDPDTGALWSEARRRAAGSDDRRAVAGIAGWVARTGRTANAPHASTDPRWLGPLDDPDGDPHSQLLVQPLIRADERVHGVLIAARRARRPGFTETDAALLGRFAAMLAPLFEQLAIYVETKQLAGDAPSAAQPTPPASTEPLWLAVLRGHHALSRWLYLGAGALVGVLIALLA